MALLVWSSFYFSFPFFILWYPLSSKFFHVILFWLLFHILKFSDGILNWILSTLFLFNHGCSIVCLFLLLIYLPIWECVKQKRFQNDMAINNGTIDVLRDREWVSIPWKKLQVGDLVKVMCYMLRFNFGTYIWTGSYKGVCNGKLEMDCKFSNPLSVCF